MLENSIAPPDSGALKAAAIMSSKTRISRGDSVKVCGELPHGGVKQWYFAVTVTGSELERLKTRTSEWKKLPPTPWMDAATGTVMLVAGGGPIPLSRPILFALISVNQIFPSGPAAICRGLVNPAETKNSVRVPEVVIRPILLPDPAYQSAPSAPRVMPPTGVELAALNCVMMPLVVMRPTLPALVNQSAPSGPDVMPEYWKSTPPGTANSVMQSDGLALQPISFVRSIRAIRTVMPA